jgi:hypothetical protein
MGIPATYARGQGSAVRRELDHSPTTLSARRYPVRRGSLCRQVGVLYSSALANAPPRLPSGRPIGISAGTSGGPHWPIRRPPLTASLRPTSRWCDHEPHSRALRSSPTAITVGVYSPPHRGQPEQGSGRLHANRAVLSRSGPHLLPRRLPEGPFPSSPRLRQRGGGPRSGHSSEDTLRASPASSQPSRA